MLFKNSQNMIFIKYGKPHYNSLKTSVSFIYEEVYFCASDQCFNMALYTTDIFCLFNGIDKSQKNKKAFFFISEGDFYQLTMAGINSPFY